MTIRFDKIKQIALDNLQGSGYTAEDINQWDVRAADYLIKKFADVMPAELVRAKHYTADYDNNGNWIVKTHNR